MKSEKKREVKDISIEQKEEINEEKTLEKKNSKNNNSFYNEERSWIQGKGKWYEDVRKKSLLVFVASLVIIGGMIPAGMVASGYFKREHQGIFPHPSSDDEKINFAIKNAKNEAYIKNLNQMKDQGWSDFDSSAYNYFVKHTNEKADKKIKSEKESMRKRFGNTWKTEWQQKLSSEGFANDKEYKNSIIATDYKNKTLNIIKTQQFKISEGTKKDSEKDKAWFVSDIKDNNVHWLNSTNPKGKDTFLTEQNLMKLFILLYQPVQFNDTLTPFTPYKNGDSGTADITGDSIKISTKQIKTLAERWKYLNLNSTSKEEWPVITKSYNKIMSENNLSLPKPIEDVAVYQSDLLKNIEKPSPNAEDTITSGELANSIKPAFGIIQQNTDPDKIPPKKIDDLSPNQLDEFGKTLVKSLASKKLLNSEGRKRSDALVWTDKFKKSLDGRGLDTRNNKYVSYIGEDGLHFLGVTARNYKRAEKTDTWQLDNPLVKSYLNVLNDTAGKWKTYGLEDNFNSWVESNLDDIIYGMSNKIFDKKTKITNEVAQKWLNNLKIKSLKDVNSKYKEAKDFYVKNSKLYDNKTFIKSDYFSKILKNNNMYNEIVYKQQLAYAKNETMNNPIAIKPKEYDTYE